MKFGPKHHPLHHSKEGSEHGQVAHKNPYYELRGVKVQAGRSRKTRVKVGM